MKQTRIAKIIGALLAASLPAVAAIQCWQTKDDADEYTFSSLAECTETTTEPNGDLECVGSCSTLAYLDKICKALPNHTTCEFCDPENTASENVAATLTTGTCRYFTRYFSVEEGGGSDTICICLDTTTQQVQHPVNAPTTGFDCESCREGS